METNNSSAKQLIEKLKDFADEIYREIGSGHAEKIYEQAILVCLRDAGFKYEHQKVVELTFRGHYIGEGFADIVVRCGDGGFVVLEIKAVSAKLGWPEITQIKKYMSYLKVNDGLLMNFPQPGKTKSHKKTEVEFKVLPEVDNSHAGMDS
ncbi:MAG: GxxExxY protein [Terracidiphilus sp.]|jgi:GxxExxY protein